MASHLFARPLGTALFFALACTACDSGTESPTSDAGCVGAACGGGDGSIFGTGFDGAVPQFLDGAVAADPLPCEVKKVFDTYCTTCHVTGGFGGFPLATLADLRSPSRSNASQTTAVSVVSHITAAQGGPVQPMPPAGYPKPSAAEIATVTNWVNAGANPGAACTPPVAADGGVAVGDGGVVVGGDAAVTDNPDAPIDTTGLTCYKLVAHPNGNLTQKYKVGVATDVYVNMTFGAPWQGTAYAAVIRPVIDNKAAIHHWLLFKDGTAGTPGKVASSSGAHPSGELVYGWAPGGSSFDYRESGDTGLVLENTTYTMEYHYNSKDASAEDASGVEICLSTKKPTNLVTQSWLGTDNLVPATTWTGTCDPASNERIHIIGISPHMHVAGTHMKGIINRKNGTKETLHDLDFDFNYQRIYKKDVWIEPGDTITTTCTYSTPKSFGKGTNEEMCYLFSMAYPGGALADNAVAGRTAHGANSCLGGI